ncbi:MAG: FliM/FliN family flagellar motor switch protein [Solirubrobacteraceae bacterium]|nr:FliM/FliN family flagellar motor switch protein [Solirubrobacteraceae bacterium]
MSDGILDPSQIDALLEQAAKGELPEAAAVEQEDKKQNRWLRVVDFSRPAKFGPDQENRMRRLHEAFCRMAGQRLAGQHRIPMELEVIDTQQRTWRDAYKMVSRDAVCAKLEIGPYATSCLMAVEMPLLLKSIDKLLGSDDAEPTERKLTGIDMALVARVLGEFTSALSLTWQDLAEVEFSLDSIQNEADAEQAMAASEPTLAIAMEARLDNVSSTVLLLLPHGSVQPALAEYAARTAADLHADPAVREMLHRRIGEAAVNVRAELGSTVMGLHEVLSLKPGDSIRLGGPPPGEADLMVDDFVVCHTRAGRHGSKRAVQVDRPVEEAA